MTQVCEECVSGGVLLTKPQPQLGLYILTFCYLLLLLLECLVVLVVLVVVLVLLPRRRLLLK